MPNDTPTPGTNPDWGQPQPAADSPTAPWPADPAPGSAPWPTGPETPAAPPQAPAWPAPAAQPAPGSSGSWGAPASSGTWGAPPQPQQPAAPAWGGPPAQQAPQWGGQQPQQPAAPAWGAPPPQQPGWGAPPPQQPQQPGWGAPPPQQPQQPGWGAPGAGGPPVGWAPAPQKSGGNGCLKGCLIAGVILVVLGIVAVIAVTALGMKFASDMGVNPDGTLKSCEIVSNENLATVLPGEPQAMPMQGLVDATIGQVLDKRVLKDASDCWLVTDQSSVTGRLARQDTGDGTSAFANEKANAESGAYYAKPITGVGDEAFCTGVSEAMSVGVLARSGNRLVYVSLIDGEVSPTDLTPTDGGVVTSAKTCDLAAKVAEVLLK